MKFNENRVVLKLYLHTHTWTFWSWMCWLSQLLLYHVSSYPLLLLCYLTIINVPN